MLPRQPQRTPTNSTPVALQPHSHQPTARVHSSPSQCAAVMDVYSPSDLSGMYSRPCSISAWMDSIFVARGQSELAPAQPPPRPLSTASAHTQNTTAYTTPRTRRPMMNGSRQQRNAGRTERVTRSTSQRHEKMTAEVVALHISEDNVSEEMAIAETVNNAQNETYDSQTSNCIAQLPPLANPELAAFPLSSAEPH